MQDPTKQHRISPDAMIDPANEDGGGHDAASALAFQIVENSSIDQDIARRMRRAFGGDTEANAALRLGISITAVRRACRAGRPSARVLRRVCLVYNIDGHWLLTGEGSPEKGGPPAEAVPSEQLLHEVARRLAHLTAMLDSARSSDKQAPKPPKSTESETRVMDRHWL